MEQIPKWSKVLFIVEQDDVNLSVGFDRFGQLPNLRAVQYQA